jgi:16S rRNA (guanine527-N7)-methyltransferase
LDGFEVCGVRATKAKTVGHLCTLIPILSATPPLANLPPPIYNPNPMDPARITDLLEPFLGPANDQRLTTNDLLNISTYIDLLLRWNARINLTAIREPEEIVTRHFGESLFAARHLFPRQTQVEADVPICPERSSDVPARDQRPYLAGPELSEGTSAQPRVIDVGSGAGFPGIPIKIWAPQIHLTLIESNQKKSTFLREVVRTITLTDIDVFPGRAEDHQPNQADVVTVRAVENFHSALPTAIRLLTPAGHLALLIGEAQLTPARSLTPDFSWQPPIHVPLSTNRILLIGTNNQQQ